MFDKDIDQRFSSWYNFRQSLINNDNPLKSVNDFWKPAPFVPYNHKIDRHNQNFWPTPWEIIIENKYDDFTKSIMIGWTLKFSEKYKNSCIELRCLVDNIENTYYNVICVDNEWILNYLDGDPIRVEELPKTIFIEYLIELVAPK